MGDQTYSYVNYMQYLAKILNLKSFRQARLWSFPENEGKVVFNFIRNNLNKKEIHGLQIGGYLGVMHAFMVHNLIKLNPRNTLVTIDPNINTLPYNYYNVFHQALSHFNLIKNSLLVLGRSETTHTFFRKNNMKFDFLFIDGNHEYEYAKNDFMFYEDLIRKKGLIIFDDVHKNSKQCCDGPRKAVADLVAKGYKEIRVSPRCSCVVRKG